MRLGSDGGSDVLVPELIVSGIEVAFAAKRPPALLEKHPDFVAEVSYCRLTDCSFDALHPYPSHKDARSMEIPAPLWLTRCGPRPGVLRSQRTGLLAPSA